MSRCALLFVVAVATVSALRFKKVHKGQESEGVAKEAVVVMMKDLTPGCQLNRVVGMADSSSSANVKRDFYILYGTMNQEKEDFMKNLLNANKIRYEQQPAVPQTQVWKNFGGKESGDAESAFVVWASTKGQLYDFVWHLEDDAFYTGPWHELFDTLADDKSSVVGKYHTLGKSWHNWENCKVKGKACQDPEAGTNQQFMWPVARFSANFMKYLRRDLSSITSPYDGHHEALTANYCKVNQWCTLKQLPNQGVLTTFGWGEFKDEMELTLQGLAQKGEVGHVEKGKVYHPVKCQAGEKLSDVLAYNAAQADMPKIVGA